LEPNWQFDGSPEFELESRGLSDADYVKDSNTQKNVSGNAKFLNGSPVIAHIRAHQIVVLSMTEAELFVAL
jgi:hypothetical protein